MVKGIEVDLVLITERRRQVVRMHVPLLSATGLRVERIEVASNIRLLGRGDTVEVESVDLVGVTGTVGHGDVLLLQLVELLLDLRLEVLELGAQIRQRTGVEDTRATFLVDVGDLVSKGVHQLLHERSVERVDSQPGLDHGSLTLLERERQPRNVVQGETKSTTEIEIASRSKRTTVQLSANHNHHSVELKLHPTTETLKKGILLGEEILVEDGERAGVVTVPVQIVRSLMEGGFLSSSERVRGTLQIVRRCDALQIAHETLSACSVVGDHVLADGRKTRVVDVSAQRSDEHRVDASSTLGSDGVYAVVVVGERDITTLNGGGKMHGVSDARAEHGVHLSGDGLNALKSLQLGTQMTQMSQRGVSHTGRDEDVTEGAIQLVRHILVVRQHPTGQIANFISRTFVDGGEGVHAQERVSELIIRIIVSRTRRSMNRKGCARGSVTIGGGEANEGRRQYDFHHGAKDIMRLKFV